MEVESRGSPRGVHRWMDRVGVCVIKMTTPKMDQLNLRRTNNKSGRGVHDGVLKDSTVHRWMDRGLLRWMDGGLLRWMDSGVLSSGGWISCEVHKMQRKTPKRGPNGKALRSLIKMRVYVTFNNSPGPLGI